MVVAGTKAVLVFYSLVFAGAFFALFIGIKNWYKAIEAKNEDAVRRAQFIVLFASITIVAVGIISFFTTGSIPF